MADRRLRVFHAVAKHLSFTKAADALFMTQPAVTFQIKQLEEHYNARLFDRAQGRITLTADHRRYANLSKECVVIGSIQYLEIWDAQAWQDYQETHEENFSAASDETLRDII